MAAFPAPSPGARERRLPHGAVPARGLLRVRRTLWHDHAQRRRGQRAPDARALLRRGGPVPSPALRLCIPHGGEPGHLDARVRGGHGPAPSHPLLRARRALRDVEPVPDGPSPFHDGRGYVHPPVRNGSPGPRHVLPGPLRRQDLALHRHRGRGADDRARHPARRARRLPRRPRGPCRQQGHRGAAVPALAAALDGVVRGAAGALVAAARLLRHHDHPVALRLDGAGAAGARKVSSRCGRRSSSWRRGCSGPTRRA